MPPRDEEDPDYDRGYEDARQGRYNPPDGKGLMDEVGRQVFGASDADKSYHDGYYDEDDD